MNRVLKMEDEKRKAFAEYYKVLLSGLDLTTYKKSRYITSELNIPSREWRKHVENILHLYMYGYLDKLIIGTNKGYLLTDDVELINKFLTAKEHQFKSLAYNCYNLKKAVMQKDNYTMEEFLKDNL